jgi:hypothetical protein
MHDRVDPNQKALRFTTCFDTLLSQCSIKGALPQNAPMHRVYVTGVTAVISV